MTPQLATTVRCVCAPRPDQNGVPTDCRIMTDSEEPWLLQRCALRSQGAGSLQPRVDCFGKASVACCIRVDGVGF